MVNSVEITGITLDKAYYHPGETVQVQASLSSKVDAPSQVKIRFSVTHLADEISHQEQAVTLNGGDQSLQFSYTPPQTIPAGYGIDLQVSTSGGTRLASASAAFDVLNNWTQNPRYGFMTDFQPGRTDLAETMQLLTRYHINGLQFYDWMYRHEQFLTDIDPYTDLWSKVPHSIKTVDAMIQAAHDHSIAAMPYTAVYGASMDFYKQHPDWVLYDLGGKPTFFGGDMMAIMDPRPSSPWTNYLLDQFDQVLQKTAFDGIHLDQYGDPKVGYDANHKPYDLAPVLADFINQTKVHVDKYRSDGAVVFNCVTNWPVEAVAPANEDFVYIEVWSPYNWFSDLHQLVVNAQKLSGGKPVVLAAYIDATFENNARLMDAAIFASGGGRIELGENDGMLAEAYFPRYKVMSPTLAAAMQRYYDFMVRYENVIGPSTQDATRDLQENISVENVSTSPSMMSDKVWSIVRQSDGMTAINLINLLGVSKPEWASQVANPPTPLANFKVTLTGASGKAAHIWVASPDQTDLALQPLAFTQSGGTITMQVPELAYWDMILIEWSK